jgi:predicted PurR-regulated permease PerM
MTGLLTKRFFHILAGIIIAILCFFSETEPPRGSTFYDAMRRELHDRLRTFMLSFDLIFGAQIMISVINTAMTAAFLSAMGIPFMAFLVPATFVLGLLPVVGNVLSNTLIVSTALILSPKLALIALVFLIVMHKVQFFLILHVVGDSLKSPMWLILLGIVVGELMLGVPGIVLAPALLHYLRVELQTLPHESRPL